MTYQHDINFNLMVVFVSAESLCSAEISLSSVCVCTHAFCPAYLCYNSNFLSCVL